MKSTTARYILILLFLLGVVISCNKTKTETPDVNTDSIASNNVSINNAQSQTADIKLGKIEQRTLCGILKTSGKLDVPPQNLVSVSAPFGGFLQSTEMLQGKPVKKGERIAVIQNPEYIQLQQDYLDSKSQVEFLEAEYKRQEELSRENVNSQKTFQHAKAAYFSKLATVKGLYAKLKILNINFTSLEQGEISNTINLFSPIDGFITEVNFNIGSFVNPTDVLFKIVDTNHLHAELTVFEKDIVKVKKGQKIRFTLSGDSKERFATVYLVGREISGDRTVRVHGHLDDEDHNLLPGMYLNAVIELGTKKVDALPNEAVVDFEGKSYIFVSVKQNQYHMIEAVKGVSELGYTEVTLPDSLNKTDRDIVVNGAYSLLSKMKNTEEEE